MWFSDVFVIVVSSLGVSGPISVLIIKLSTFQNINLFWRVRILTSMLYLCSDERLTEEKFSYLVEQKYQRSLAEPGEAVGLLAAQVSWELVCVIRSTVLHLCIYIMTHTCELFHSWNNFYFLHSPLGSHLLKWHWTHFTSLVEERWMSL